MIKGFVVTVVKEMKEKIPVVAESAGEARAIIENLISRGDTEFMFRGVDDSEADYYAEKAEAALPQYFDALREEVETVQQDGRHDYD